MRPIRLATLDKRRPVLNLTRELMVGRISTVTVAPITSIIPGIATEVLVGPRNGLAQNCGVTCDQITRISLDRLHDRCGWLVDAQEFTLHDALQAAFDRA